MIDQKPVKTHTVNSAMVATPVNNSLAVETDNKLNFLTSSNVESGKSEKAKNIADYREKIRQYASAIIRQKIDRKQTE